MKALSVGQNGRLCNLICDETMKIREGFSVYRDTGEKVTCPHLIHDPRPSVHVPTVWVHKHTFEDYCQMFPLAVQEISKTQRPNWGSAYYIADEMGEITLHSENWDSSD